MYDGALERAPRAAPAHYGRAYALYVLDRLDSRLNEPDAEFLRVPYRCNRAMLFCSTVIHGTEEIDFSTSYAERRINITCLYGRSQE